jgi:kynureninase
VVVDGYHAFMAIPVDLGRLAPRIFYLAGGYKYAQAGEGACFMSIPEECADRPIFTGWFADFAGLGRERESGVAYAEHAFRFWGSTFDPSGIYRFNAVMRWLAELDIGPREIRSHVKSLERRFCDGLAGARFAALPVAALTPPEGEPRGNFLAFDLDDAEEIERKLDAQRILIDRRGRRIRFGFGVYHDEAFVDALLERLHVALG